MENLFKAILDIFRTHNILLYVVCIVAGLLSYNVMGVADLTGYNEIKAEYKNYIGLIFLVSAITIIVLCIKSIITFFHNVFVSSRDQKRLAKLIDVKITNLTNQEKAVLLQFFIQQSETIWLPFRGQEVVELLNAGILSLASNTARMTRAGEAAMLKLPNEMMQKLAQTYPDIYSNKYKKELLDELIYNHTPESVRVVNENRNLFGY
ncbi:super-infection exclusion protein B [Acinetobacter celticus]|uniref:Superinfection exclusion protein B n=1 Tax=Acinetobacter celticus TaxID=1891224 RepID=A0A1C3CV38_9GAMM|nr:super-infection exclusion protein B [Acinetobacter celticus]ODA12614.1 hypothetical protein BBP83_08595 [Acinetobacter celticus]